MSNAPWWLAGVRQRVLSPVASSVQRVTPRVRTCVCVGGCGCCQKGPRSTPSQKKQLPFDLSLLSTQCRGVMSQLRRLGYTVCTIHARQTRLGHAAHVLVKSRPLSLVCPHIMLCTAPPFNYALLCPAIQLCRVPKGRRSGRAHPSSKRVLHLACTNASECTQPCQRERPRQRRA